MKDFDDPDFEYPEVSKTRTFLIFLALIVICVVGVVLIEGF